MRVILLILMSVFLNGTLLTAQTMKAYIKAGDKAYKEKNYSVALEYYKEAMEFNNKKPELWYRYAEVARMYNAFEIAELYYNRVESNTKKGEFPLTPYWLATVYKSTGDYQKAKKYFNKYISSETANKEYVAEAKRQITSCEFAMELVDEPDDLKITQLNKRVNTSYSEFGPLLKGDTLYYSSFRFKNKEDENDPPRRISKVLASVKGAKGRTLPRKFNDSEKLTAHTAFSKDQKRIYFTICEYENSVAIKCQLYYREKDKRKRWIVKPKKLPDSINDAASTCTQPCVGYHKDTGKEVLYFVSDRAGGKGGLDIWYTEVKGKKFSKPVNLEALNTEGNEVTPFFHDETQNLFFSSDHYQGLGGFDIFYSKKNGTNWSEVTHTGFPLNSSYNDLYYTITPDSTQAYFASNRLGSFYLEKTNKACCNDIYKATFAIDSTNINEAPPVEDSLEIVVDIPKIEIETAPEPKPVQPKVPTTLEDFLPLALYFHNDEPDRRTRKTTTKKSYEETFFSYYSLKDEYRIEYPKPLPINDRFYAEDEIDFFFENKIKKGYDHLNLFSEILLVRLEAGEQVEIFVKGFTSPRAKSDYNLSLGQRRISSVRNHFATWRGQTFKQYLDTGQLIVSERSFGETTASSTISDDLYDRRNSIYHPAAAEERRVEIVEIKRN